jgi:hypothetical protein
MVKSKELYVDVADISLTALSITKKYWGCWVYSFAGRADLGR